MKKNRSLIISILVFVALAAASYFWATGLMASLYAFRSPLKDNLPQAGKPTGAPLARRVVAIMVDGLRTDIAADPTVMPFLNSLSARGASATIHSSVPSYSIPGWSVLATGAWQELSDAPAMNPTTLDGMYIWTRDNIFTSARRAGLSSAVAANIYFRYLIPAEAVDAAAYTEDETTEADQQNMDTAVEYIRSGSYNYIFTYITMVDHTGHVSGSSIGDAGRAAASRADEQIKQVVDALDLSQDIVLIYSDHGHIDAGGHGGQDSIVLVQPFIMAGAAVKPGQYGDIHQVDIAPTTAALLGAAIPAISQGRARTEMLGLSIVQAAAIEKATSLQQAGLYQAYAAAMGVQPKQIIPDPGQNPVDTYQIAMQQIRNDRLLRERLPRLALALILALLPVYFLYKNRTRSLIWILAGVLVYLAVFHFQYAILQHGTYSLSSVLSAASLISSTAIMTLIAVVAAWLVVLFGLGLFRLPRSQAGHLHLVFSFTLLFIIALPAGWSFGYNGALVTWSIPDMASMFLGFLSTLQLIFAAAAISLLMGVTALISKKN